MADPIEPVPSAPPREPTDVPTNPDSPPAQPFDVPIFPDEPPTPPFDVPIFPDAGPVPPFDVKTSPDGPPAQPFDVATDPDLPPGKPFDVATSPDGPPRVPTDVPVTPDAPPGAPVDVPVSLDGPPAGPFDVTTTPDAPPGAPFQVPTSPDLPPTDPFDVGITPDGPPVPTFDVPVFPDLPEIQFPSNPSGQAPTMDQIIAAVNDRDAALANFLSTLLEVDLKQVIAPGGGALDPRLLADWFRNYLNAVGPAGLARFVAEQSVLYALNPDVARVFNPTYLITMMIPGSMGHIHPTIDTQAGITMERVAQTKDQIVQGAVFLSPDRPAGNGKVDRLDIYGPENKYSDGQAYSVDSMIDAIVDKESFFDKPLFLAASAGGQIAKFDASALFEPRGSNGSSLTKVSARFRAAAGSENVSRSKLAASNALDGVIRVAMPGEEVDGSVLSTTQDPSEVVDDDDARVPLSFTDLRVVPGKRFRSVYFRPTNLQFSEHIGPEYVEGQAFGRVDPTIGYSRTQRTVTVSFDVHAMAIEDLELMYNKMTWLKSMCYPTLGVDGLMQSGPVVRMRIGDAVGTDLGGVPGVIRTLNFDFADAMWELRRGMKVPRMYKTSLDFLVLHDGPVGIVNGTFGVFQLPPGGPRPDKSTNLAGNPNDSRSQSPESVTALPGRFARFGEPRRT